MKSQVTVTVNIQQAKEALAQTVEMYFAQDAEGNRRLERNRARPVCLMGPTGIGKTEIVRQVAQEKELAFLSYSVTHHTRQSAIGLPRLAERQVGGQTVCVTEYTLSEIIAEVWRTMEESGKKRGILFLDEFNCVSETLKPAMLQLLQSKTFGPHALPDGWMLVLAGNPGEYNASACALDPVMADRMRLLWLAPDYPAWRTYMAERNVHPMVLSYLDDHRGHFYVFEKGTEGTGLVTARGWEVLSVLLKMMEEKKFTVDLTFISQFLQSSKVARSFYTYYQQYSELIYSGIVDLILNGTKSSETTRTVAEMTFTQRWALTCVVLLRLENVCASGSAEDSDKAMNNVLYFYRNALEGQPQMEFLLNGITNSDPCAIHIATHGCEVYRVMAKELFFNSNAPSVRKLKNLLDKTVG